MKKLSIITIAIALVLIMVQCKKNAETISTPVAEGNWVDITLNVGGSSKHDVNTATGAVTYTSGDVLYVGNNGKFVGTLTYNSGAFSGSILNPSEDDYLCFYFIGGLTPSDAPVAGTTTSFNVNISNQTSKLPVLSYGRSSKKYKSGDQTYIAILGNKCALVKFETNVDNSTVVLGDPASYYGLYNVAEVSFSSKSIAPTYATGTISIQTDANGVGWAILLECEQETTIPVSSGVKTGSCTVPELENNDFYEDGIDVVLADRRFSVAANKQIRFSPGNLQYNPTHNEWRFAEHQYDICTPVGELTYLISYDGYTYTSVSESEYYAAIQAGGLEDAYTMYNAADQYVSTYSGWIDLFGWGRWGTGLPYDIDENLDYSWNGDFYRTLNGYSDWYTLTGNSGEWEYLFSGRTNAASKFGYATVGEIHGIILLPDDNFVDPNTNDGNGAFVSSATTTGWDANIYTESGWNAMEIAGAVFLPTAGRRFEDKVRGVMEAGFYWSSTGYSGKGDGPSAYSIHFEGSSCFEDTQGCPRGCAVRLVRTVQ